MELIYNAKENRKELVKALVTLTQQPPAYAGPPTYSYYVGNFTVDRNGNIVISDDTDETVLQELIDSLDNMGFTCIMTKREGSISVIGSALRPEKNEPEEIESETTETEQSAPVNPETTQVEETLSESSENSEEQTEPTHVTLSFPLELFAQDAIDRMRAIVASKSSLLKKALDTDNLDITIADGKVCFPWFTDHGIEGEVDAYSKLAYAIAKMAITQNRVLATEKQNADEKLAMRLFLVRLNFIGDEYKTARAILMRNFNSNESRKKSDAAVNLCMPEVSTNREVDANE